LTFGPKMDTTSGQYVKELAPEAALLDDLMRLKEEFGGDHNAAFDAAEYEQRFALAEAGMAELERLVELSRDRDVYLVCQCKDDQRCHRELLLLLAKQRFGAEIESLRFEYPIYLQRLRATW
jgi:uncharacterized protein YeaO (DUF488 family)